MFAVGFEIATVNLVLFAKRVNGAPPASLCSIVLCVRETLYFFEQEERTRGKEGSSPLKASLC